MNEAIRERLVRILRPDGEFIDGPLRFIDRRVEIGLSSRVRVCDGNATQRLAAENMRLLAFFKLRII